MISKQNWFFISDFFSKIFTIHRTTKEEETYLFKSSLPLSPLCRYPEISQAFTAGSLHVHTARSQT